LKRAETKSAKLEYEQAVLTRSTSQQNVNSLLERKHSWSDNDVAEFTKLVRSDHASRHAVTTTSNDMKQAELSVDKAFTALMQSILERYHEEQVWSDKIRSVSTWASIVALAANLIVFVGAMAFVEPWKRRRLVQGLEERMTGMMDRVEGELRVLSANVAELHAPLAAVPETSSVSAEPASLDVVAVDDSDSPPSSPPVADDVPPDTSAISDLSPIEMLSERAPAESQQSRTLGWISAQLSHLAPPTIERDLAAAGLVGAVGGAVTVGLVSLIVTSFRG
jgi:sensitive to high expression protein 9